MTFISLLICFFILIIEVDCGRMDLQSKLNEMQWFCCEQLKKDVFENIYRDSLVTWIKSFN